MNSVWTQSAGIERFNALEGDLETDILIIGGGLAGLLLAAKLHSAGADYALVEAKRLCSGVTKNTTAKITAQHGLVYNRLIKTLGEDKARLYLQANELALEEYRRICRDIDCDFETKDNYVYSSVSRKKIDEELAALRQLGYEPLSARSLPVPVEIAGAVGFSAQAQFNPLKFVAALAPGLKIYENTEVRALAEHSALTKHGTIRAKRIVVTTHFPFINKHGGYFLKLYQDRSYVIALENAENLEGMYIDEASGGFSFRNYKELLFIGGGSHRTGKKGSGWQPLEDFARERYPSGAIKYRWATQDCMTLDGAPYIGSYSKRTPDFYVATGFNKWGMSSSMVASELLTGLLQGKKSPCEEVFSPSRSSLHPQLALNGLEAAASLLTPTKPRCPHLGCALKWNAAERSWDCPCHGSRFTENGELIDNPATGDLP